MKCFVVLSLLYGLSIADPGPIAKLDRPSNIDRLSSRFGSISTGSFNIETNDEPHSDLGSRNDFNQFRSQSSRFNSGRNNNRFSSQSSGFNRDRDNNRFTSQSFGNNRDRNNNRFSGQVSGSNRDRNNNRFNGQSSGFGSDRNNRFNNQQSRFNEDRTRGFSGSLNNFNRFDQDRNRGFSSGSQRTSSGTFRPTQGRTQSVGGMGSNNNRFSQNQFGGSSSSNNRYLGSRPDQGRTRGSSYDMFGSAANYQDWSYLDSPFSIYNLDWRTSSSPHAGIGTIPAWAWLRVDDDSFEMFDDRRKRQASP